MRKDWDEVKDDVMRKAVWAKFTQHETPKRVLLSTGDSILVEHTKNDAYWADGSNGPEIGTGKNMLGKILMETRDKLRAQ